MRQPDPVAAHPRAAAGIGTAPPLRDRARALLTPAHIDAAVIISITAVAAALRLWRLGSVPLGLHGDEAWTGLDARRILDEGWIGPYVISALGQPTGPLYATAALFKVLPQDTFTVRVSMAIFGIATIPLAYALFASMYNRTVAAFAALILTGMAWHLHLSRTGFMVTTQPFMEMLVLLVLWQALRRDRWPWYAAAGALFGLGIYSYNAYTLFLPVPCIAIGVAWLGAPGDGRRRLLRMAAIFLASAAVVAIPMIWFIITDYHTYHVHQTVVGLTDSRQWHDASLWGKPKLVWDRAVEWQKALVLGDRPDLGDGLATDGHPVVDPLVYALALAGLAMTLWRLRPRAAARTALIAYAVPIAAVICLPWGALLTVDDGLFRRTLGLAPFVALFAALPLASLWQRACALRTDTPALRAIALGALLLIPSTPAPAPPSSTSAPSRTTSTSASSTPTSSTPRPTTWTASPTARTSTSTATAGHSTTRPAASKPPCHRHRPLLRLSPRLPLRAPQLRRRPLPQHRLRPHGPLHRRPQAHHRPLPRRHRRRTATQRRNPLPRLLPPRPIALIACCPHSRIVALRTTRRSLLALDMLASVGADGASSRPHGEGLAIATVGCRGFPLRSRC